ncbi:MAG: M42 family peptidase [Clostridia bacterium]|nr:M42 family peptidase [Clostridia bacterium]
MLNQLKVLTELPGISGREEKVREYIISQIKDLADEITVDNMGSVIALKKGSESGGKRLMISAHMDEVGLIITHICPDGMLKFSSVGGIDPRVIVGRQVFIGDDRIPGVVGIVPIHLTKGDDQSSCPKEDAMLIDIGAASREEAEKYVHPGDYCVWGTEFASFGDGRLKGKAIDDRAGCAMMIELMKGSYRYDTYFTFVTMEEVGLRGATCAAYTVAPDFAIVLEATTASDIAGVKEGDQVCCVGKGAVVGFMDRRTIYDRGLFDMALRIGSEKNIAVQVKQAVAGGNDAGAIQQSGKGVRTIAVSLPCRYIHAPCSVIAESDLRASFDLVREMIAEIQG